MTATQKQQLDEIMDRLLKENNLDWQSVHLWIINKGYLILTEEEYDKLELKEE